MTGAGRRRKEKGMKKEQKSKAERGAGYLTKGRLTGAGIIVALLAAVLVFVIMLQIEKSALAEYEKGDVYVVSKTIPKGEMLTAENYQEYLTLQSVPVSCIPATAVTDVSRIHQLIARTDLEEGILVTEGMFEAKQEILDAFREPVVVGVRAEDLYQAAGGVLRAGDRIHIYSIPKEGVQILAWEDVPVQAVFHQGGEAVGGGDDTTPVQRFNIYLEKSEVARFYRALEEGSLRVALTCE